MSFHRLSPAPKLPGYHGECPKCGGDMMVRKYEPKEDALVVQCVICSYTRNAAPKDKR